MSSQGISFTDILAPAVTFPGQKMDLLPNAATVKSLPENVTISIPKDHNASWFTLISKDNYSNLQKKSAISARL